MELERPIAEDVEVDGSVWIGRDVSIGEDVRLMGPIVLGDGASVGDRRAAALEHRLPRARTSPQSRS